MCDNTSPPPPVGRIRQQLNPWLSALESEAVEIIREGVATAARPVMLYSIGKDSSVLLHLARKAFWPAAPPMPLLHVDTTWKFRDMLAFRDRVATETGVELVVHTNQEGVITPFTHGSEHYTEVMKTIALRQALDAGRYDVIFVGARREEEKSRAKERVFSLRNAAHQWDPKAQRPGALEPLQHPSPNWRVPSRFPTFQLDGSRCLALHRHRGHSHRAALLRGRAPGRGA